MPLILSVRRHSDPVSTTALAKGEVAYCKPRSMRHHRRLTEPMRMAPGTEPGAIVFVQVGGGFPLGVSPGFPQHDAHDRPETDPNGPETEHGSQATHDGP